MTIDIRAVDEALTTTRAVRLRLDLERPVDDDIILDCIDVAEQAPSGGNQGSRRWIIVRDRAVKERIAELYMETGGNFMIGARDKIAGTGHPQEGVMKSAAHLAEHLAAWQLAQEARLRTLQIRLDDGQLEIVQKALSRAEATGDLDADSPNRRAAAMVEICRTYVEATGAAV